MRKIRKQKSAEEGTYSDLIKKDRIFKGLVEGQLAKNRKPLRLRVYKISKKIYTNLS